MKSRQLLIAVTLGLSLYLALGWSLSQTFPQAQAARLQWTTVPQNECQETAISCQLENKKLPLLQTTVVTLTAVKDNTLYEDAQGDLSNGVGLFFFAGRTGQAGLIRRGVIAFNIAGSGIPPGATIISATLQLRMSRTIAAAKTVTLHRLLADWGEGSSFAGGEGGTGTIAAINDATWLHRFFSTAFWTTPGGDFSANASASTAVADVGFYSWSSPQMAADVQSWFDSPATNFGWLVKGEEGTIETAKRFDSRENDTAANRPVLFIEYSLPAPQPNLVISKQASNLTPSAGQVITYTIVVANTGALTATNSTISDTMPAEIDFAGPVTLSPPQPGATLGSPPQLARGVTIRAGRSITLTFPITINLGLATGTRITNTATVTSSQVPTPTQGVVVVTINNPSTGLVVNKTVNTLTPKPGDLITYTVVVANNGALSATSAVLSDTLPVGLSFVGPVTLSPFQGGVVLGSPPTLASGLTITAGQSITLTFPVSVNSGVTLGTPITNIAAITSAQVATPTSGAVTIIPSNPAVNASGIFLPLILKTQIIAPDLVGSFSLTPNTNVFAANEPVQITVIVTNQGTAVADSFWVDFFINPNPPPVAANTIWSNVCGLSPCYGLAWFVPTNLAPGQSIILTSTPGSYAAAQSIWPGFFAKGTTDLYLYVDSWNPGVVTGGVLESNESNNRAELHGLTVSGLNRLEAERPLPLDLPPRPARLDQ